MGRLTEKSVTAVKSAVVLSLPMLLVRVLVARVPDLPGCATEGKTKQELMKNVKEAIQAYLEDLKANGDPVPVETVQVSV